MRNLLEKYGYRQFMAPENEGNGGGEGDNKDTNAGGEGGEGEGKKQEQSALDKATGLLSTRKKPEGETEENNDAADKGKQVDDGRPKGLADKFWNPEKKSINTDALIKAHQDAEKALGTLRREKGIAADVPEKPEGYFDAEFKLPEEVDRLALEGPDDPGLKAFSKVAHKYGIGKDAARGIVVDMMREMNATAAAPIDPEAEREALGDGADELIDGVYVWLEGMERSGKFGADDIDQAINLSQTAQGIRFLAKCRSMTGAAPIPLGLPAGDRGMSAEDWHTAYREAVKAGDYKEQARLDSISASIFGTEAGTGPQIQGIPNQKDVVKEGRK